MKPSRRLPTTLFVALVVLLTATATASAEPLYGYNVRLGSSGFVKAYRLDTTKTTTLRVMRGAVEQGRVDQGTGVGMIESWIDIQAGDVIQIYQGVVNPPHPPVTPPTETFTVPNLTATGTAGSQIVTGAAENGTEVRVKRIHVCTEDSDSVVAARSPGSYSATFATPNQSGDWLYTMDTQPDGDIVISQFRVPGDTPCIGADAQTQEDGYYNATPFKVFVNGLDMGAIPTVRTVLRRAGTIIGEDNSGVVDLQVDRRPQPGDVVEVYRPAVAAAPTFSWTIPQMSGVFDAGGDLAAIDAPASHYIEVEDCRAKDCGGRSTRMLHGTAAGRSFYSFKDAWGWDGPVDVLADDQVFCSWYSSDGNNSFRFNLAPGDLTAPKGKLTVAKRLNLRRKLRIKLSSNEAGKAVVALTVPKLPSTAAKRSVKLATAKATVKSGVNTISLKLTKAGKKSLKRISRGAKAPAATLTVKLTDAAGNSSTITKKIKLSAGG